MRRTKVPKHYKRLRVVCYIDTDGYKRLRFNINDYDRVDEILPLYSVYDMPWKKKPCVYFLLYKGKVIYIGASQALRTRLKQHFIEGKVFDEVRLLPNKNYYEVEKKWIKSFQPLLNKHNNPRDWNLKERTFDAVNGLYS